MLILGSTVISALSLFSDFCVPFFAIIHCTKSVLRAIAEMLKQTIKNWRWRNLIRLETAAEHAHCNFTAAKRENREKCHIGQIKESGKFSLVPYLVSHFIANIECVACTKFKGFAVKPTANSNFVCIATHCLSKPDRYAYVICCKNDDAVDKERPV